MAGLFALSTDPTVYKDNFLENLFWGVSYHQHLGEQYAGLSTCGEDGQRVNIRTCRGLLKPNFEGKLGGLDGTFGIGYCGSFREPFRTKLRGHMVSLCFCGNITNRYELISRFESHLFQRGDDIEVIANLIAQEKTIVDGIKRMNQEIRGSYSLLILTEQGIYAAVSSDSRWPLVVGQKEGALVIASESGGFDNLGFEVGRMLEPGEIVFVRNGHLEHKDQIPSDKVQICSFLWVYTTFPNAKIYKIPASLVRKRLGAALARRDIGGGFTPHIVIPVPDSGRFHAIGYHQEFCRQMMMGRIRRVPLYEELFLKYGFPGRSFTPQREEQRNRQAFHKILTSGESLDNLLEGLQFLTESLGIELGDLIVVLCEDSVVRGTQLRQNLAPKLRSIGIKEIHVRASNPEILSHCSWGKTTKRGEILAERLPDIEARVKELGVDSLEYNTIDDLVEAIGLPPEQLCVDCSLKRD